MFKHILFPTDGEAPSVAVVQPCLAFARDNGARVTALHVSEPVNALNMWPQALADTADEFAAHRRERARGCLEQVDAAARAQGVACETLAVEHALPYQAILEAARQHGCDLVVMASHGRRGLQGVLMGSVAQQVLTHCPLPVLVLR